ncbi:hypothetical protein JD844_001230, partial [Phrynosoma platyrhinos]
MFSSCPSRSSTRWDSSPTPAYAFLAFCSPVLFQENTVSEAASCARGWLKGQGNCYAYFDTKKTWAEAEIECQRYGRGVHLASVLSKAESALIARYISAYQREKSNVWIGLHDPFQSLQNGLIDIVNPFKPTSASMSSREDGSF